MTMKQLKKTALLGSGIALVLTAIYFGNNVTPDTENGGQTHNLKESALYLPPDTSQIQQSAQAELIRYGRELIVNTRKYLGPNGIVAQVSNQLNCQNCHLEAGAKVAPYSANFLGVASNYPLYRDRSGMKETIQFRVNDCMLRSMNGKPLDTASREMKALVAYLLWLGKDIPPKTKPVNSKIEQLSYMDRAADTINGKRIYAAKCQLCHGVNGSGGYSVDSALYYPPLWGDGSYNTAAGMYRLSRLAGFVKNNMPFGVSHGQSQLSNEECWDVAAFINSMPRPYKVFPNDWPDQSKKAIDHPFGPYTDGFPEQQHKYGPFGPIENERRKNK